MVNGDSNQTCESISTLRRLFQEEYESHKELYYQSDFDKIMTDDWYVKRFLLARDRCVDKAYIMLKETMAWRRVNQLCEMNDASFPAEFYKIGGLFAYEPDKRGKSTVYIRIKMHIKIPEVDKYSRQFVLFTLDKVDKLCDGDGITLIMDFGDTSFSNLDLEYLKFLIDTGSNYFPRGIRSILVLNIPWTLRPFKGIALSFMPPNWSHLVQFVYGTDIFDHIDQDKTPDYLGGSCNRNYRAVPPTAQPLMDSYEKYDLTRDDVDRVLPLYKAALDEAEIEIKAKFYQDPINYFDKFSQLPSAAESIDLESPVSTNDIRLERENGLYFFPSDSVKFSKDYMGRTKSYLFMENRSDEPIAFQIEVMNSAEISTTPSFGIILAQTYLQIKFEATAPCSKENGEAKIVVKTIPINETSMDSSDFERIWSKDLPKQSTNVIPCCWKPISQNGVKQGSRKAKKEVVYLLDQVEHLQKKQEKTWILVYFISFFSAIAVSYLMAANLKANAPSNH